jgi:hypothetical protein
MLSTFTPLAPPTRAPAELPADEEHGARAWGGVCVVVRSGAADDDTFAAAEKDKKCVGGVCIVA